jgi:YesN/AraC family two-component response regulator
MEIEHQTVLLGEVSITGQIETTQKEELIYRLKDEGFELIDDKKSRVIEQIKKLILELIKNDYPEKKVSLSNYLSENLHHDYTYISSLFSSVEGKTIENYFILQKIEKIKEYLVYDELSISEISYKLGYSSVAHLSNQFKKVTGLTPSHFKSIGSIKRQPIDNL